MEKIKEYIGAIIGAIVGILLLIFGLCKLGAKYGLQVATGYCIFKVFIHSK